MPLLRPADFGFEKCERSLIRQLRTPERIQRFLDDEVLYNNAVSCLSPRRLIRERRGHCMEGGLFAAAVLRLHGHPPCLLDLQAQRDVDHVIALFRRGAFWGAISKSNCAGLRYREPVYRTLRELVMSYFEHYCNARGERTLRGYSRPIHLEQFDSTGWMTAEEDPWQIPNYLVTVTHTPLFPPEVIARLRRKAPRRVASLPERSTVAG